MPPPARHMKYPYTYAAKLVHFPYKFQYKTNYSFRFGLLATAAALAIYWQVDKLVYTPENKAVTEAKRAEERHYHYKRP